MLIVLENSEDLRRLSIRGLNADRLRTLYYVAKLQNVTLAADKLGICQSAVSKQIQLIEDELGVVVFHRRDRRFVLTHVGGKIFKLAEKVLFEIDGTLKSIKEEYAGMGGTLKILTFPSFASVMVPRYLKGFNDQYPDITLKILACYENTPANTSDIAIRAYVPNQPHLEQLELYRERYALYASEEYLTKYGEPKDLESLDSHKLLAIDDDLEEIYPELNWILKVGSNQRCFYRKAFMYYPSNDSLAQAVISGMGVAGLAKHHVKVLNNPDIINVMPCFTVERSPICFVFNREVESKQRYLALYEYLVGTLSKDKDCFGA